MKLVSFTVQNFRGYQVPFKVNVDSFTAILEKNDIGKSALFEALSIFFEQSNMDQNGVYPNKGTKPTTGFCYV